MIDGGVFGVCACGRPAHWLSPAPVLGRGEQIGCASSPAVLERTRSLQLSSVGSCEPRKKPCDPSQTRRRFRVRLKAPSIQLTTASLAAQTLDMATSILGVSLTLRLRAKVGRESPLDALLCRKDYKCFINTAELRFLVVFALIMN